MRLKTLIYCLLFCLIACNSYAAHFNFIHYTTNNSALPHDICYQMMQDRQGYLWIATDDGLLRFDGRDMKVYQRGFKSRFVISMAMNDSLFLVSSWKGSIHRMRGDTVTALHVSTSGINEPFSYCNNMLLCGDIVLLFRFDHIYPCRYRKRDQTLELVRFYINGLQLSGKTDYRFVVIRDRIVAYNHSGIYVLSGNVFRQVSRLSFRYITQSPDGLILAMRDDHIYRLGPGLNTCSDYKKLPLAQHTQTRSDAFQVLPSGNMILTMREPAKKNLFNPRDKYLFVDVVTDKVYDLAVELQFNLLTGAILPGRNGDFWISTDGDGLYHVFEPKYRCYGNNNEFKTPYITALVKGNEGQLYVGTKDGIYALDRGMVSAVYPNYLVYSFFRNKAGNVLARSRYDVNNIRLNRKHAAKDAKEYERRETAHYILESQNPDQLIRHRIRDKRSGMLLPDTLNIQHSFPIIDLCEDAKGTLWLASVHGLYYWDDQVQRILPFPDPALQDGPVNKLQQDDAGGIWAGSSLGLFYIKNKQVLAHYNDSNGLSNNCVNAILLYRHQVWTGTQSGLNVLDLETQEISTCKRNDGLQSNDITAMCFYNGDTIAIGSSKGITLINAARPGFSTPRPRLIIEDIYIGKYPVSLNAPLVADYRQQFSLRYNVITYTYPELARFRYRLSAQDAWIETQNKTLVFSNLEPGNYRIELQARTYNSNWSEPLVYMLAIKNPWWNTWPFYSGLLILSVLLALLIVRSRERRYKQRMKWKQQFSELKLKALQTQLNPHFISNTLNTIQLLSLKHDEIATSNALTQFAQLTRLLLESSRNRFITLKDELQILDLYLCLEQLRFGDRFTYTISIEDNIITADELVPGVLLQPFAENSINHGIAHLPAHITGHISIDLHKYEELLIVGIRDNGIGRHKAKNMRNAGHPYPSRSTGIIHEIVQAVNTLPGCYLQADTSDIRNENGSITGTRVLIRCSIEPSYKTEHENNHH